MAKLTPIVDAHDHIQGNNREAEITLLEFGDYECPSCGEAYGIIKALQQAFGDRLLFVFRNFPLQEVHPHAYNAALAAEAAGRQHRFWEMHDLLFENQNRLTWNDIAVYAESIDLDMDRFQADLNVDWVQQRVERDIESGLRSGVNGTPSFYINGSKYDGDWGYDSLADYLAGAGRRL